jgi:hypothetical protein
MTSDKDRPLVASRMLSINFTNPAMLAPDLPETVLAHAAAHSVTPCSRDTS